MATACLHLVHWHIPSPSSCGTADPITCLGTWLSRHSVDVCCLAGPACHEAIEPLQHQRGYRYQLASESDDHQACVIVSRLPFTSVYRLKHEQLHLLIADLAGLRLLVAESPFKLGTASQQADTIDGYLCADAGPALVVAGCIDQNDTSSSSDLARALQQKQLNDLLHNRLSQLEAPDPDSHRCTASLFANAAADPFLPSAALSPDAPLDCAMARHPVSIHIKRPDPLLHVYQPDY